MTETKTFPTEIDGIRLSGVRRVREWIDGMNREWVSSPVDPTWSCYDREAGMRSRRADYEAQQRNLAGLRVVIAQEFAPMLCKGEDPLELVYDAAGTSIGIRCDLLDYYESELGLVEPLEAEWRARRLRCGDADAEERWDRAFFLYAHACRRGVYHVANTDWSQVSPADWQRIAERATRAAQAPSA